MLPTRRRNRHFQLRCYAAVFLASSWLSAAHAHFQLIRPNTEIVEAPAERKLLIDFVFTHPMANGPAMPMGSPTAVGVLIGNARQSLLPTLRTQPVDDKPAYQATYEIKQPGDHIFYIVPAAYWEPAEAKMIIHYSKTVVNAFGDESDWDAMVGLPVEIQPLTRPYGLWAGNLFRGVVWRDGKPVPHAQIEVEYLNSDAKVTAPADPFLTQVIKADAHGVFSYAMPWAGWWGFAALLDGDAQMANPDGAMVDVELGALIWVRCRTMP